MKHVYLKLIVSAALVLPGLNVSAAPVDADAALEHATSFLSSTSRGMFKSPNVTLRLAHVEPSSHNAGLVDYYVFNAEGDAGYILVAGDDRVEAILGYGPGRLDMSEIPENLRWLLDEYKSQIEWLREHPGVHVVPRSQQTEGEEPVVEPMLTSMWGQGTPYNDQCVMYNGRRCVTGCIATAMAQVMNYWKYPAELPAVDGYVTESLQIPVEALPPVILDWDNMLDTYSYGYSDEQGAAVATLMRYCGQAALMDYTVTASGAHEIDQLIAFKQFGYNHEAKLLFRNDFGASEWKAMLDSELLAGHPIPFSGYTGNGGHAFILDGCKDGKYHVNWGNYGYDEGYYEMDLLGPPGYEYKYNLSMNYKVYPADDGGSEPQPAYDFEVDGIYYQKNGSEATVTCRDQKYNSYHGDVVIPSQVEYDGVTYRVTAVGDGAFSWCDGLTSVSMLSIERFGSDVFVGSNRLREVSFGKAFTSEFGTFARMTSLQRVNVEDVGTWASIDFPVYMTPLFYAKHLYCDGQEVTDLVIGDEVKSIGRNTFIFCEGLENVTIGDGVASIGRFAFAFCPNLEKVTIGNGNPVIHDEAFEECPLLAEVTFNSVSSIGEYAFSDCPSLKSLIFPASLDSLGYASFLGCTALERVDFQGANVKMAEFPFYQCSALTTVKLPSHQTVVGYGAFYECTALRTIDFGDSLDSIAGKAFNSCIRLQEITLPESVTAIGGDAFAGCRGLKRVNAGSVASWVGIRFGGVNANPLSVARHLYVDGEEVTQMVVPKGVSAINDYAFHACEGLTSATIGKDVQTVGEKSFYKCTNLAEVTLGNGVKSIGELALGNCTGLKRVTLGRGLELMDSKAFNASMVINEIVCKATTPPVIAAKDCFSNAIYKNAVVRVPAGALAAYQSAPFWSQFEHLEGVSMCDGDVNGDGEVNIGDVNAVIDSMLRGKNELACDANFDGDVNIADVNAIIGVIFGY